MGRAPVIPIASLAMSQECFPKSSKGIHPCNHSFLAYASLPSLPLTFPVRKDHRNTIREEKLLVGSQPVGCRVGLQGIKKEGRQEGKALRGNGRRDVWSDVAFFFRKHATKLNASAFNWESLRLQPPHSSHRIESPGNKRSYSTLRRTRVGRVRISIMDFCP